MQRDQRVTHAAQTGLALALAATVALTAVIGADEHAASQDASTVMVVEQPVLGAILADAAGMALYGFEIDPPGVSVCEDLCATTWPPLRSDGEPTASPEAPGALARIERADGSTQVTFNDMALYYYAADRSPGDARGHNISQFGGRWFAVQLAPAAASPTVAILDHPTFGRILTDPMGFPLYKWAGDEPDVSNYPDAGTLSWPPLASAGDALPPPGLGGTLGVIVRSDGSPQVSYEGWPLYLRRSDPEPGAVTGHGSSGGLWTVVEAIEAQPAAAREAPGPAQATPTAGPTATSAVPAAAPPTATPTQTPVPSPISRPAPTPYPGY